MMSKCTSANTWFVLSQLQPGFVHESRICDAFGCSHLEQGVYFLGGSIEPADLACGGVVVDQVPDKGDGGEDNRDVPQSVVGDGRDKDEREQGEDLGSELFFHCGYRRAI
jgi:hypothetical protein